MYSTRERFVDLSSTEDEEVSTIRVFPDSLLLVDPFSAEFFVGGVVEVVGDVLDQFVLFVLWEDGDVGFGEDAVDDGLEGGGDGAVVVSWFVRFEVAGEGGSLVHGVPVHVSVLRGVVFVLLVEVSDLRHPWSCFPVFEVPDEGKDAVGSKRFGDLLQSGVPVRTPVPGLGDDDSVIIRAGIERFESSVLDGDAGGGREKTLVLHLLFERVGTGSDGGSKMRTHTS